MKYSSVWLLVVTGAVGAATAGCSSSGFSSCESTYSCVPSAGSAGAAGSGASAGSAGSGAAGSSGANGGSAGSSGGSAGSSGGSAGSGGSAAGAGGSDGGAAGSGGSAGAAGAPSGPPVLFGACDQVGALACETHASATRLACDGSKWQAGTTCPTGQLCDSSDGSCQAIVSECATAKPGDSVCRSGDIPLTCGPDLVTVSEGAPCDGLCNAGQCVAPSCGDNKLETGEQCDDGNTVATDACTATCSKAACGDGVLYAGHETCDDKNVVAGDGCSKTCAWEPVAVDSYLHSCAIGANGALLCWGDNSYGALGQGDTTHRGDAAGEIAALKPVLLGTKLTARQVAVGRNFSCALLSDGSVKCWGHNGNGQLGQGDTADRGDGPGEMGDALKSVDLGTGRTATSVGAGDYHACAVLDDGLLRCWGQNTDGQAGWSEIGSSVGDQPGELGDVVEPVALGSNRTVKQVAVGGAHTCALLDNGRVKCFGSNGYGQLGISPDMQPGGGDASIYVELNGTSVAIAAGYSFSCAISDTGRLQCWGENSYGMLGVGTTTNSAHPQAVDVGTGRTVKSIALGRVAACAVLDNGQLKCWGGDPLGYGDSVIRGDGAGEMGDNLPAIDLGTNETARQVTVGYHHMCALTGSGALKCWGLNGEGELGIGNTLTIGDAPGEMGDKLAPVGLVF